MNIKLMPEENGLDCCFVCSGAAGTGFIVLSLIFQKGDDFYQFINQIADVSKKVNKKPTKPGKRKAAECFKKLQKEAKDYFLDSNLVAAKIESRKHGVFVMVSYEKCPVDIIEYLISERN